MVTSYLEQWRKKSVTDLINRRVIKPGNTLATAMKYIGVSHYSFIVLRMSKLLLIIICVAMLNNN